MSDNQGGEIKTERSRFRDNLSSVYDNKSYEDDEHEPASSIQSQTKNIQQKEPLDSEINQSLAKPAKEMKRKLVRKLFRYSTFDDAHINSKDDGINSAEEQIKDADNTMEQMKGLKGLFLVGRMRRRNMDRNHTENNEQYSSPQIMKKDPGTTCFHRTLDLRRSSSLPDSRDSVTDEDAAATSVQNQTKNIQRQKHPDSEINQETDESHPTETKASASHNADSCSHQKRSPTTKEERLIYMNQRALSIDIHKKNTAMRRRMKMQRSSSGFEPEATPPSSPLAQASFDSPNHDAESDKSPDKNSDMSRGEVLTTGRESNLISMDKPTREINRKSMRKLVRYSTFDDSNVYAKKDEGKNDTSHSIEEQVTDADSAVEQMKGLKSLSLVGRMRCRNMERNYTTSNEQYLSPQISRKVSGTTAFHQTLSKRRSSSLPDSMDSLGLSNDENDEDEVVALGDLYMPRRMAICTKLQVPAMKQLESYLVSTRLKQYCLT